MREADEGAVVPEDRREPGAPRPGVVACAWCGLLSSDRELWYRPPPWLSLLRLDATVSHGICPACFSKLVPSLPPSPGE